MQAVLQFMYILVGFILLNGNIHILCIFKALTLGHRFNS